MTNPYAGLPTSKFWRPAVATVHPSLWTDVSGALPGIDTTTRFATAGSCFAQHIGRVLKESGCAFLDYEPAPAGLDTDEAQRLGFGLYSARYGNVYSSLQLVQLAREALGMDQPRQLAWRRGSGYVDGLRTGVMPQEFEDPADVLTARLSHLEAVRRILTDCEVFVFTLGLTEVWTVEVDGQAVAVPSAPGVIAGSASEQEANFMNLKAAQVRTHLEDFLSIVGAVNPHVRLLLTVSPVPLTATATADHVLTATMHSKSVLRTVAGEMSQETPGVMYFPSYELLTTHACRGAYFNPDLRTVSGQGVELVMAHFKRAAGLDSSDASHVDGGADCSSVAPSPLCDEEAIWNPVD